MANRALTLLPLCWSLVALAAAPDEASCKKGNAGACARAGRARIDAQEYAVARPLLERGCQHGSAEACDDLGWIYDDGLGLEVDKTKAAQFYAKACAGNFLRGCTNEGVMHLKGEGFAKDSSKAAELFQKACDGGNATDCFNVGKMYEVVHATKAATVYRKACEIHRNDRFVSCIF